MDAERRPAGAVRAQPGVRLVRRDEAALDDPARELEQLALQPLGVRGRVDGHGGLIRALEEAVRHLDALRPRP